MLWIGMGWGARMYGLCGAEAEDVQGPALFP